MNTKKNLAGTRGWFPQEPTLNILRNTSSNGEHKIGSWASCPFLVPGALMIFAALLSANFGLPLVSVYLTGCSSVTYSGLYIGVFSVVGFVLGLIWGVLLLAGKRIHIAAAGITVILCFGLATIVIPIVAGLAWTSGLIFASPMIAFPAVALIQVGLNSRKLKAYTAIQEPKPTIETEPQPINRKPVAAGLGAAGFGLLLVGLLSNFEGAFVFSTMVDTIVIVTGAGLIAAAYLERRAYKHCGEGDYWK